MSADVIKEFLVSLGYRVDSTGERKFVDGVKNVTAVTKMASELEDLYFMSQRTNASASNIKAIGFAASQMGSSVEGARGSIESLAKFLRENPGGEGLIGSIGVQTRDVNGALRDTTDIMQDIGKRLSGMPQYRAIAYANVFGIDYKTLVALEQGVDKFSGRYKELLRRFGLNVQDATKKSHDLMVSWRDMKASAGILSTIVGTTLIGVFDELNHRWQMLDETTKQNIETGAKWAAGIVAGAALIAGGPLVWIAALAAVIVALWDDYQVWKEGGKSLIDWGKWEPGITAAIKGLKVLGGVLEDTFEKMKKVSDQILGGTKVGDTIGEWTARTMAFFGSSEAKDAVYRMDHGGKGPPSDSSPNKATGATRGIRNNNPGNIIYGPFARKMGATGQDAAGFAIFPDAASGLRAISANLQAYGNKGVNTPSAIAHRWSTTDQDAYTQRLASMFGGNPNQPLNMKDPSVLDALRNGIILQENGRNPYSAEMLNRGGAGTGSGVGQGVSIDQSVTIQVHASDKTHEVASAIGSEMNGVNDRLVRNMKGVAA